MMIMRIGFMELSFLYRLVHVLLDGLTLFLEGVEVDLEPLLKRRPTRSCRGLEVGLQGLGFITHLLGEGNFLQLYPWMG
jgi:hypothetical protein